MKIRKFLTGISVFALVLIAINALAQEPALTLNFSDVMIKTATEVDSYACNDAGYIAGDVISSAGVQYGLILKGIKATAFSGPSGSTGIAAYGINSSNTVAGWYYNSAGTPTGFTYANGTFTTIAYPGAENTEANGLNDNGWVVGSYVDTSGVQHGFYFDGTKYHDITVSGAFATVAWAVNNSNVITVYTTASTGYPADSYTLKGTTFTMVDVPGYTQNALHGIDKNGDLVYTVYDSSENRHGVLYQASTKTFTEFDDPNGTNGTRGDGINDSLDMVGRYTPPGGSNSVGYKVITKQ